MFTCALDPNSRMTLCDQLYAALRAEIERGGLPAGSRMPSKRELAAHLHVSTATVEAAYARLTRESARAAPAAGFMFWRGRKRRRRRSGTGRFPCAGTSEPARRMRRISPMRHGRG